MADDLDLDELLCFDLYAASRAVTALYRPLLAPLGLTYPQYLVLVVMWAEGRTTIKRLSERLQLDYGTLTPLLRRMETSGLLTRSRSAEDERSVLVELTPAGRASKRKLKGVPLRICEGIGLTPDQMHRLQRMLRTVAANATG